MEDRNLFTAPYDWRMDITRSTAMLAAKIAQAVAVSPTGKDEYRRPQHGRARPQKYLVGLPNAPFLDKVVLVGVPELGAPYAFKVLNYGDDLSIPVVNPAEVKKIAQNMPSLYELLPAGGMGISREVT